MKDYSMTERPQLELGRGADRRRWLAPGDALGHRSRAGQLGDPRRLTPRLRLARIPMTGVWASSHVVGARRGTKRTVVLF